jgi:hydrogenase maturation protease
MRSGPGQAHPSTPRRLVLGLGNPLAGDDGVGWHVAERLRRDPRVPPDVDVMAGGTDLLRLQDALRDRPEVVLVDAILDRTPPGTVTRFDGSLDALDDVGPSVHQLPPTQALQLLRRLDPAIRDLPVTFLGVAVGDIRVGPELSPALSERLDEVVARVLEELADR